MRIGYCVVGITYQGVFGWAVYPWQRVLQTVEEPVFAGSSV
jgi:hypothetical protein